MPVVNIVCADENPCINKTPEKTSVSKDSDVKTGHGDGETK